jgi:hypothetical protein
VVIGAYRIGAANDLLGVGDISRYAMRNEYVTARLYRRFITHDTVLGDADAE